MKQLEGERIIDSIMANPLVPSLPGQENPDDLKDMIDSQVQGWCPSGREGIEMNIRGLEDNLQRGTHVIKMGHRVQGISDGSEEVEVVYSPMERARRQNLLHHQREVLEERY